MNENKFIKLYIADDHQMFIDGIQLGLQHYQDIQIIGKANNGRELLKDLQLVDIDVLLLDINMPHTDGVEVMQVIQQHYKNLSVIILSTYDDYQLIQKLLKLGIKGYLIKTASISELTEAIYAVAKGEVYFHKKILETLKSKTEQAENLYDNFIGKYKVTPREFEILKLVVNGKNTKEIAESIFLSILTVDGYRKSLLKKLNVKNTAELVKFVYENNILV
ncbi:MAG: response regulator transcription factor [Thermonemataceae bacterium]|nr:response regulator transcription factor [Thermonemataceae bacterium]